MVVLRIKLVIAKLHARSSDARARRLVRVKWTLGKPVKPKVNSEHENADPAGDDGENLDQSAWDTMKERGSSQC